MVPNGTATGLDIGLSNFSLSLITLSFYTMCKSTTPIFLLAFCFMWGIEKCGPARPASQGIEMATLAWLGYNLACAARSADHRAEAPAIYTKVKRLRLCLLRPLSLQEYWCW